MAPPWAASDSVLAWWRRDQGPRCARQIHRCPPTVHAWRADATDCRRGTVLLPSAPHSRRLCIHSPSIALCIHTTCPMMHHHCSPLVGSLNGTLNTWTPSCVGPSPLRRWEGCAQRTAHGPIEVTGLPRSLRDTRAPGAMMFNLFGTIWH
ncbi:hypothetical protein OH76DRAFT_1224606 [Lentinus brumalis]|uniref:Uncharacterized protein n=1 Tax=Lentinus brumalis TaxID=2498619 RepID=A0A371DLR6_9APHY|nr:hypothetical protein OH76DRAFT_1224606 [Polyporus brumalis]